MQIAALKVAIDHIDDIGPPETVAGCITVLPEHFQLLKVVLHAAEMATCPGISGLIDADIKMLGGGIEHGR